MGKGNGDPTNSKQYFQGHQVQELGRNPPPETINDAPPPAPKTSNETSSTVQSFPPTSFQTEQPRGFPPPQETPQVYPPPHETPAAFPPPPPPDHQPNVGMQPQFPPQPAAYYQPQNNYQYQQTQQQGYNLQPGGVSMGQPMGTPPTMYQASVFPVGQQPLNQAWKSGLFDCFNDPENAIITLCFPCVTFGQIAEILDSGSTSCATSGMFYSLIAFCIGMPWIMSCSYRTKLRSRFGLPESPAPDWLVHCFCDYCALCQEYRELKQRNIDPAIGWQGNLARQQQFAMNPPLQQRMV